MIRLQAQLNHVAILVPSVAQSATVTQEFGFANGPAEAWEGEGTLEIYVGEQSKTARLLLMEAAKDGAYKRAFQKRGPGLHHVAIDVLNLEQYILQLSGSGWLLHPQSLKSIQATQTAYLARPGIPFLVEVQQRDSLSEKAMFVSLLEVPVPMAHHGMLTVLGVPKLQPSHDQNTWLTCHERRFAAVRLVTS